MPGKDQKADDLLIAHIRGRVRALRTERNLSAQRLVDMLQPYGVTMSRSAYSNFEYGLRDDITFHEAIALALALDVELVDLITDPEPPDALIPVGERDLPTVALRLLLGSALSAQGADEGDALLVNRSAVGLERERTKRRLAGKDPGPPTTVTDHPPGTAEAVRRQRERRKP